MMYSVPDNTSTWLTQTNMAQYGISSWVAWPLAGCDTKSLSGSMSLVGRPFQWT